MMNRKMVLVCATMDRFLPRFPPLSIHFSLSAGAFCVASFSVFFSIVTSSVVPSHRRSRSRRVDNERERKSKSGRRLRRVEKTVEALSHGLILALTTLKSESGGQSGMLMGHVPVRAESHGGRATRPGSSPLGESQKTGSASSSDATGALLTALSGLTLSEHSTGQVLWLRSFVVFGRR